LLRLCRPASATGGSAPADMAAPLRISGVLEGLCDGSAAERRFAVSRERSGRESAFRSGASSAGVNTSPSGTPLLRFVEPSSGKLQAGGCQTCFVSLPLASSPGKRADALQLVAGRETVASRPNPAFFERRGAWFKKCRNLDGRIRKHDAVCRKRFHFSPLPECQ